MLDVASAERVIDHGVDSGADFAELFIERSLSNSISTLSQQVQSVESGIDFGIGIRLVFGDKVLYGYTNKTADDELKRIISELAAMDLRDPRISRAAFNFSNPQERHPARATLSVDAEVESKIAYLRAADTAAKAASNLIAQSRGACRGKEQRVEIFNSEGLHTQDVRHYIRATLTAIAADGQEQATGMWSDGGLLGWEMREQVDPLRTGEEAARQAIVNLGAKACPSGRMPVVIGNGFGGGDFS